MSDWLQQAARVHASTPALIEPPRSLDYATLADRVARTATEFAQAGIRAGDRVALPVPRSAETVVRLHALLWLGAAAIPLSPTMPTESVHRLWRRLDPCALIGPDRAWIPPGHDGVFVDSCRPLQGDTPASPPAPSDPGRIATIVLTSGSRGDPKAVPLSVANHAAATAAMAERSGCCSSDRWLVCLPLDHVGGLSILIRSVILGCGVVLQPRFDPVGFAEAIAVERVTLTSIVPSMLAAVLQHAKLRPPGSLRGVFVGGARADPELLERARASGWPVIPTWGMTEAGSQLATPDPAAAASMSFSDGPAPALPPLPGVSVRTDAAGRLRVRGPMLFGGYVDSSDSGPDEAGWFTTGDRGSIDGNGAVRILGRGDGVIISGGINVNLEAVARRLLDCPLIEDAVAIGVDDVDWGQRVAAAVVPRENEPEGAAMVGALTDWAHAQLEPAERPRRWRIVERIPRSSTGKPQLSALRRLFE